MAVIRKRVPAVRFIEIMNLPCIETRYPDYDHINRLFWLTMACLRCSGVLEREQFLYLSRLSLWATDQSHGITDPPSSNNMFSMLHIESFKLIRGYGMNWIIGLFFSCCWNNIYTCLFFLVKATLVMILISFVFRESTRSNHLFLESLSLLSNKECRSIARDLRYF